MLHEPQSFFERIRIQGNPKANPESIVICGQARFTILTPRLIRIEWEEDGQFEDRGTFAFPTRYAAAPTFSCEATESGVEIKTDDLSLRYNQDGQPLHPGNLCISFDLNGERVEWKPGKPNPGNLRGTRRTLDQCAGAANLSEGLLSREGWSIHDDSGSVVWDESQTWVEARSEKHIQDWYFFGYGHDYKALLSEYIQFGGAIPLVPRYVLGAWWSRFWAYHADDLKTLVNDFGANGIPLDVLVVDMDWHTPDGWTGYTWNRELFPEPEAFLRWAHTQQLYVTLNLHPAEGVQKHEEAYPEFSRRLGRNPQAGEGIPFSSTDKLFVENYFALLHHPLEDQGIDFWWLDWQQGSSTDIKNLDPLPWLNHLHFQDATRRGTRPMLYSRWGGLGNHRYPIGFSGDAYTTWDSLAFQPYFTATAANVAYGWWSHDIGGHFGAADPELYARWVQFGAVSPCLRLHSTKDPLAERRPWAFPEPAYRAAKAAIQFRYQLLPYLYSAARAASTQGLSLCYPMYYEYPSSEDAYLARDQYFLGDQLIVAPIVRPVDPQTGLAEISVWIPDGTWIEFTTMETFVGPRWVRLYGDLNRIPMFARAGAIVPMAPDIKRTTEFDGSHIILTIFPGADGWFELYEDNSNTQAYKSGEYEVTPIRVTAPDKKTITLSIMGAAGHCPSLPGERTFEVHVRGIGQPDRISINQAECHDWSYDAAPRELVISIRDVCRDAPQDVTVHLADEVVTTDSHAEQVDAPFVHHLDYPTFEDASKQLGTIIIVPPSDNSAFDAEVEWTLLTGDETSVKTSQLTNCTSEQIIHSPFYDDGSFTSFRWRVTATVTWSGKTTHFEYQSKDAYPSITHWQKIIYNPEQQPISIRDVLTADGKLNTQLEWSEARQTLNESLNLKQPFGMILLEQERERITAGEPLEACAATSLESATERTVILHLQAVGDATVYCNGEAITPIHPIDHSNLDPMFYSWMPPTETYYSLTLKSGENPLVIFTRPNASIGWWGIGATVFDTVGKVVV